MLADTTRVLAELVLIERHVGAAGGQWYLARVLPYRTTENQINGVVLTLVDITEQKRAAQALGESEERYRALTNASSHVLYRMSPDWSEMRQLQGDKLLALTRMPNSSWLKDYIHPADHESFRKAIRTAVSTKGVFEREHRVRRADGSWGWTFSRAVPMLDAAGEIIEWFGAASDVTERKRVEEALIQSEERLRRAFQIETVGVLFFDINGRITEANNAFLTMSGYNQADLNAGQISRDKMTPPEWMAQTATALEEFTTTGRTTPYEKEYLRKDGSRWWALFASTRLNPNEGVEFILDVTSRKHAEHALEASRQELITALQETEKARQEAEAAGRAKDHFLAILSHELRTPLTPVMMVGEMLLSRKDLSAYVRDGLETICRNVQLETLLIDDLLDVTKISNGKFEIQLLPFDLHEAVRRAIEITTPDIEAKNQCLSIDFGAKYSRVCGDVGRLQQVFWNLLKNASKFTAPKGDLRIASRNEQNAIVIEITDSGRGIDPETLSRIFQAFQQGDESVTREFGGLGLGLAISKATLDAHHGKLSASSDGLGQGSLFTVELPLVDAAE